MKYLSEKLQLNKQSKIINSYFVFKPIPSNNVIGKYMLSNTEKSIRIKDNKFNGYTYAYLITYEDACKLIEDIQKNYYQASDINKIKIYALSEPLDSESNDNEIKEYIKKYDNKFNFDDLKQCKIDKDNNAIYENRN